MIIRKPWGHEEIWAHTDKYVGKILLVKHGHRLSLQYHKIKDETMRIIKGVATIVIGTEIMILKEGQFIHIPPGIIHRVEAHDGDVEIVEVSTPELDDVVRVQDDYSR